MHPVMWYNKSRKYYEEKEKEKKWFVCCISQVARILFTMRSITTEIVSIDGRV